MPFELNRAVLARVLPFLLFMAVLALRGALPVDGSYGIDQRWVYGLNLVMAGGALVYFWRDYIELHLKPRLKDLTLAVVVGLLVFVLWINLDAPWMQLDKLLSMLGLSGKVGEASAPFKPLDGQGQVIFFLVAIRWLGATLLVPLVEELFWRSFLMRWVDNPAFEKVDPRAVTWRAVTIATLAFMLAHTLWLAAIIAGLAYAWLYWRTGSLWTSVLAHAVTNGVLGVWVVSTGNWAFW
jgi:CAAX prenyl protease-like protein